MPRNERVERRFQYQLIAGFDRPAEARLVDTDEVQLALLVRIHTGGDERENAGRLRQCLENDHARQHRPMREMSRKERLVEGHVLERTDRLTRLAFQHAVDEQKRIPMRQTPHDFVDIHGQYARRHGRWR